MWGIQRNFILYKMVVNVIPMEFPLKLFNRYQIYHYHPSQLQNPRGRPAEASTPGAATPVAHRHDRVDAGPRPVLPRPPARRRDASRVPSGPMHWVLQTETRLPAAPPGLGGGRRAHRLGHRLPPVAGRSPRDPVRTGRSRVTRPDARRSACTSRPAPAARPRRAPPGVGGDEAAPAQPRQDRRDGEQEDLQVEPERPVLDVVVVPLDAVGERGLAAQRRGPAPSPSGPERPDGGRRSGRPARRTGARSRCAPGAARRATSRRAGRSAAAAPRRARSSAGPGRCACCGPPRPRPAAPRRRPPCAAAHCASAWPSRSPAPTIVRNFSIVNSRPSRLTRGWR